MNSKKPLALLLVALLAVGMVSMFAAAPVAAQDDNSNECQAAASSGDAVASSVGAYQDTDAVSSATALIDNDALVEQINTQAIDQDGVASSGSSSVNQVASNSASNSAYVSQCEANQDS